MTKIHHFFHETAPIKVALHVTTRQRRNPGANGLFLHFFHVDYAEIPWNDGDLGSIGQFRLEALDAVEVLLSDFGFSRHHSPRNTEESSYNGAELQFRLRPLFEQLSQVPQ